MPPQRTIPPAKAVKTERTHEENQERAYIAASRRSDRSLEARVESARRASEIHKRRTGRSLRVTEQDVINEEMYEEEDDDLPMQYRRLTAHLQTGSADFNRRLSAYLTNHVAMRTALSQAVQDSYAQQYPGTMQFGSPQQSMYQSPMLAHQAQQNMIMQQQQNLQNMQNMQNMHNMQQGMPLPNMHIPSNPMFQQTPYMQQQAQGNFRPTPHSRSASIANPQDINRSSSSTNSPVISQDRRASMPPITTDIKSDPSSDQPKSPAPTSAAPPQPRPAVPTGGFSAMPLQTQQAYLPQYSMGAFGNDFFNSPFSTALPAETQMMLGPVLDPNDPLTAMFMAGSNSNFNYNFNHTPMDKLSGSQQTYPNFSGLNSTLASAVDPSHLELFPRQSEYLPQGTPSFFDSDAKHATSGSTAGTPGLTGEGWDQYIDAEQWEMPSSSQ